MEESLLKLLKEKKIRLDWRLPRSTKTVETGKKYYFFRVMGVTKPNEVKKKKKMF